MARDSARLLRTIRGTASVVLTLTVVAGAWAAPGDLYPTDIPDGVHTLADVGAALEAAIGARVLDADARSDADLAPGIVTDPGASPPIYTPAGDGAVTIADALGILPLILREAQLAYAVTVFIGAWDERSGLPPGTEAPAGVATLEFELAAPEGAPVSRTVGVPVDPAEPIVETFDLVAGNWRIDVEALDDAVTPQVLFRATRGFDVSGSTSAQILTMVSADDATPPTFAGSVEVEAIAGSMAELRWPAATDDATESAEIGYAIYLSDSADGLDELTAPTYRTEPGQTAALVTGLTPGETYYFDVRAIDGAGNEATLGAGGASSKAAGMVVMPPPGAGLYVDSASGADGPACGDQGDPCKTITQALTRTAGNASIYLAPGDYGESTGESFPLTLKPGIRLIGTTTAVRVGVGPGVTLVPLSRIVVADQLPMGAVAEIIAEGANTIAGCEIVGTSPVAGYHFLEDVGGSLLVIWSRFEGRFRSPLRHNGDAIRAKSDGYVRHTRIRGFNRCVNVFGDDTVVYGNVITNCTTGISPIGRRLRLGRNVVAFSSGGIVASQAGISVSDTAIYLNTLHDNHRGIDLQEVDGVIVTHNRTYDNSQTGIQLTNSTVTTPLEIRGNVVSRNPTGIWINQGDAAIHGNDISCHDIGYGLFVGDEFEVDARYNTWWARPPVVRDGDDDGRCTEQPIDVCYRGSYAGTPRPLTDPANAGGGCVLVGILFP